MYKKLKSTLLLLAAIALLLSGCNFRVEKNTFYVDRDKIDSIEIQREYFDEEGNSYFRCKNITDPSDLDTLCRKIRTLPVERASGKEAHPVDAFSLIILLHGSTDHHLVMSEKMAYYDQMAYDYAKKGVYADFLELYNNFGYEEEDTEPTRFPK
ncbi:MAG: hypothetical protein IJN80_02575 [Clostridia bacterium]|nr:hypothetical protein [Clostridia bacterium]